MLSGAKVWLKDKMFQALLAFDTVVIILTIYFIWTEPHTMLNSQITISGWTSLGSLVIANYAVIKVIQTKREVGLDDVRTRTALINLGELTKGITTEDIQSFFKWVKEIAQKVKEPETQAMLAKARILLDKLTQANDAAPARKKVMPIKVKR